MQKFGYDMPTLALFSMEMRAFLVFKIKKIGIESSMISILYTKSKVESQHDRNVDAL